MIRTTLRFLATKKTETLAEDYLCVPVPRDAAGDVQVQWLTSGRAKVSYKDDKGAARTLENAEATHLSVADDGIRAALTGHYRAPSSGADACPLIDIVSHA